MTPEHYQSLTDDEKQFLIGVFAIPPAALGLLKEQTILSALAGQTFINNKGVHIAFYTLGCGCQLCKAQKAYITAIQQKLGGLCSVP